jgi:phospholipid/cholesterol/gamma-HCH transport system substrate-binding protein
MMRIARKHGSDVIALVVLVAFGLIVGWYIVQNQRLRVPLLEPEPFVLKAEMITAQAVTPGQGQTVRVAGIRIGDIAGVELREGRAIVTLELEPEYAGMVREDATALLRPKTGLKDMFLELNPGTRRARPAREGFTIPVSNTLPDVSPDEILAGLDTDTRDYLQLLLQGASDGLRGRSDDLRQVLRRFEPTYRDLAAVTTTVRARSRELRRLVNSLQRLNTFLATKDEDLAQLVASSSRVFEAFAAERDGVSATVRELPSALRQAEETLGRVERMATVLGPTADRLRPAVRQLRRTNEAIAPFAREAMPLIRDDIRPFVREARPFVRVLRPAAHDLVESEPTLTRTFGVLNRFFNMLAHNPNGREGPERATRDEGFLFHLGWLSHQVNHLFVNADAHGPGRPITTGGTCQVIRNTVGEQPQLEALLGLTGALTDPALCGGGGQSALPQLPELPIRRGEGDAEGRERGEDEGRARGEEAGR